MAAPSKDKASPHAAPGGMLRSHIMVGVGAVQTLVYSLALLALAEGIQLGLDIREQQLRASFAAVDLGRA